MTPTEKALTTWYKPDNPLYKNPEPAALGLAGEVGELVNLYKKHVYKPGFDWMDCKNCKQSSHLGRCQLITNQVNPQFPILPVKDSSPYTSIIMDELGDIWYYLRILAWIRGILLFTTLPPLEPEEQRRVYHNLFCITGMYKHAATLLFEPGPLLSEDDLQGIYFYLKVMLDNLDCTIEELTKLNYKKLSGSDNHGWKGAR